MEDYSYAVSLVQKQIGENSELPLATGVGKDISVRIVNGHYRDGAVYVVTNPSSHKMKHIAASPNAAICKGLLQGYGTGENLGNPLDEGNRELRKELRAAFADFYDKDVSENDPGCCILKIRLDAAVVFDDVSRYVIDFQKHTVQKYPFQNTIVYQ